MSLSHSLRTPPARKQAVLERLRTSRADTYSLLTELLSIPSPVGHEGDAQAWVARRLKALDLDLDVFECDPAIYGSTPGWIPNDRDHCGRPNVIGRWPGTGGGRSLVLNAHIDTVPAEPIERWTTDPWRPTLRDGRLYARGSHDDKAGIVEIIAALQALRAVGFQPRGDIIVQSVVEDEPTGNGTLACIARGHSGDAAWVIDGTPNGDAIVNHCGQLQFTLTLYGSGGSIVGSEPGFDAIKLAWETADVLKAFATERQSAQPAEWWPRPVNPLHFAVSRIEGGEWFANRPQKCRLECCMAFNPPDTHTAVKAALADAIDAYAREHPWLRENPPVLEFGGLGVDPVCIYREAEPFFQQLGQTYQEAVGVPLRWLTLNAWCDLRHFSLNGYVPAVLAGPGNGGGDHGPDEYLEVDSIWPLIDTIAAFTLDWCG